MKFQWIQEGEGVEFEATEHNNIIEALLHLEVSDHEMALVIDNRFFSMTRDEASKINPGGMECFLADVIDSIGEDLCRIVTSPVSENGEKPTIETDRKE
jgi:hypothetical protein